MKKCPQGVICIENYSIFFIIICFLILVYILYSFVVKQNVIINNSLSENIVMKESPRENVGWFPRHYATKDTTF